MGGSKAVPERQVSIAFVKILRSYFDEYMGPFMDVEADPDIEIEISTASVDESISPASLPAYIIAEMEDIFHRAQNDVMVLLRPYYEKAVVKVIGDALEKFETLFKNRFTQEELVELSEILCKKSVKKLLECFGLIDTLKEYCGVLDLDIQTQFQNICVNSGIVDRLNEEIQSLLKRNGLEDRIYVNHNLLGNVQNDYDDLDLDVDEDDQFEDNGFETDPPED